MSGVNQYDKKAIFGWTFYDWANSGFATTVIAGFFPIFFKQYWSADTDTTLSTARLGLANSAAGLLVALLAPVLGATSDRGTSRRKFLLSFACLGAVMTACLYLVERGDWPLAVLFFVIANIGFSGGNIFYDALITDVSPSKERVDFISSLGFALGYLGGGVLFAANVWMTLRPESFGFADAAEAVRFCFLLVGLWWAIFSIPLVLFVREPGGGATASGWAAAREGVAQLSGTFRKIRHLKTVFLFLCAYWLYIDGVDTIIRMAVAYGISIGFEANDLIVALLVTQFVGFPSAIGFGLLGKRIGARRAIFVAISVYLFVSVWGAFINTKGEFYTLAVFIGMVQGGIQALSRSYYAKMIPRDKAAEYFGFYNMVGKFAAVIGPALVAVFGLFVRRLGYGSDVASRVGIGSVALLFLAGGFLLYRVDEEKGGKEAAYLSGR